MRLSANILGLVISDRSIHCAQLHSAGKRRTVQKLALFPIPAEASLDQPEALGRQLLEFLRRHGFKTTRAVIGVPAKWLVAQERELPPLDEQSAYATLRLQAERLSEADQGELVFDVAGKPDPTRPARVLLVGILRKQLERITRCCTAARLTPAAITPTALALSQLSGADDGRPIVVLSRQGAELVCQSNGQPRMLRHLFFPESAGVSSVSALGGELRRAMALAPSGGGEAAGLLLWDEVGLSQRELSQLSERIGIPVQRGQTLAATQTAVSPTALNGSSDGATVESFLPAVALTISQMAPGHAPVDFLHPRLAPPRVPRIGRRTLWIGTATALATLLTAGLYFTVHSRESTAWQLEQQIQQQRPDIQAAEARLDRFSYGRGYFETRPPVLECLREITQAIGQDDPLWITSFQLRENGRGNLQGRASDQRAILAVLGRLQANPRFENVQLTDQREAGGTSRDTAFSISFTYTGSRP